MWAVWQFWGVPNIRNKEGFLYIYWWVAKR